MAGSPSPLRNLLSWAIFLSVGYAIYDMNRSHDAALPMDAVAVRKAIASDPPPTCRTDWHLCSDNSDLVNHYREISKAQVKCKIEAEDRAKFGTPEWPWLYFSSFQPGDSGKMAGKITLIEDDAKFQNGFGAMARSRVICTYDLNALKVVSVSIFPR